MQQFEGKTAVVTGAASGIGFALAERFADARMNVVLADIEADALDAAVLKLEQKQSRITGVVANTMLRKSVDELAERAAAEYGNVHVLVNNAGVANTRSQGKAVWELPDPDWEWVMGVNFYGVLYGLQAFVPGMIAHGEEGHIVNTASLAGLMPGGGPYGVSKHGVLSLTETLQVDLRARGANIGASVLCPGFVDTNIADAERNRPEALTVGAETPADEMTQMARALLAQGKKPAEIADIVFDAIGADRFYVLPHPAWDPVVRGRIDAVLARGDVYGIDLANIVPPEGETL